MALAFPFGEDVLKVRAYMQIDDSLNMGEYVRECYKKVLELKNTKSKYKGLSLEEKLINLSIDWVNEPDKAKKKKIDKKALGLVTGCCRRIKNFRSVGKEYYRIYCRLKKELSFYLIEEIEEPPIAEIVEEPNF